MMQMAESYVARGPPFVGESDFKDKAKVKASGGRWNGSKKKWEAQSLEDLGVLVRSGAWLPVGYDEGISTYILIAIDRVEALRIKRVENSGILLFNRRDSRFCELDPSKDVETSPTGKTYRYTKRCTDCNILLDTRLQFGLECDCHGEAGCWSSCHGCFAPVKRGAVCEKCLPTS